MRTVLIVLMSAVCVCLHAQAPPTRWNAGVDFQVGRRPLPHPSIGLHFAAVLVSTGFARALIDGAVYGPLGRGVDIVCVASNSPCDTRTVSQYGEITGGLMLGLRSESASPWPFVVVKGGAYATRWGDGSLGSEAARGAGPHGAVLAGGIGWHLPPSRLRLSIELGGKRYRDLRPIDEGKLTFSARISHSW